MVSVLAFYSVDPSSNPAEVYSFFCKICFSKEQIINKKRPGLAHLKNWCKYFELISNFIFYIKNKIYEMTGKKQRKNGRHWMVMQRRFLYKKLQRKEVCINPEKLIVGRYTSIVSYLQTDSEKTKRIRKGEMYHKKKQEFRAQFERTITSNTRHQGFKSNSSVIYFVFIFFYDIIYQKWG